MRFENKVVWITGASSGIGEELAKQLATQKASLILTARNEPALRKLKDDCEKKGTACFVLAGDMLQPHLMNDLASEAIKVFRRIDIAIFCAGQTQRSYAVDTEMTVYRQLMELNFFAPVALTKVLLPQFALQGSGHVVVISSVAGLMGFPLRTGYAASKHALKGFYETLQTEHNLPDFHITIVSPGRINTPISLNAITGSGKKHGLMDEGQLHGIPVDVCAKKIIRAIEAKRKHLIIAKSEKLLWWLWWFARPLYYKIARAKGGKSRTETIVNT